MNNEKVEAGLASDLNRELDMIKEVSIDVWASLTWLGRFTLYVPLMIFVVYVVCFFRIFNALENAKLPKFEKLFRKLAKIFIREKSA